MALSFEPLVVTYALDAIKVMHPYLPHLQHNVENLTHMIGQNTAPLYGADEYLTRRPIIEEAIRNNVTKVEHSEHRLLRIGVCIHCAQVLRVQALKNDMFVDVVDLQLRQILLSPEFEVILLLSLVCSALLMLCFSLLLSRFCFPTIHCVHLPFSCCFVCFYLLLHIICLNLRPIKV